jgi:effector-binding domain-containing protein
MDGFPAAIDKAFPEIFGWLEENGVALAGAPFVRYHVTGAELEIEMAAPVEAPVQADGHVHSGALPAGRYVTLRHVGPYDGLMAGHEALQQWAQEHDVALDSSDTAEGTAWRGCAEYYVVDPSAEPDPAKWEVELAYLAAQS